MFYFNTYHIACTDTGLNMWFLPQILTLKPLQKKKKKNIKIKYWNGRFQWYIIGRRRLQLRWIYILKSFLQGTQVKKKIMNLIRFSSKQEKFLEKKITIYIQCNRKLCKILIAAKKVDSMATFNKSIISNRLIVV